MFYIFLIFAALQLYLSYRSLRGGLDYLRYFRAEFAKPPSSYAPFATVIAPCKGLDENFKEDLAMAFRQDYPEYEVIFVVDDAADPAVPAINELLPLGNAKLVVAAKAENSGQKSENLREGVLHADPRSEIFVFVDSDAKPSERWLRSLAAALEDETVGAATGYRWFITGSGGFASELRSAWNASIASAIGPNVDNNFCWGGSMAVRREVFERLDIRERLRGRLSDDLAVTGAVKSAGMIVKFVPAALTPSFGKCTFAELLEFTDRQMKLTRVYSPGLWQTSFIGSGLFIAILAGAAAYLAQGPANGAAFYTAASVIFLIAVLGTAKAWIRFIAVTEAMPEHIQLLKRQFLPQITLWPLSTVLFFKNCVAALASRRIKWRGVVYEMVSDSETLLIERE